MFLSTANAYVVTCWVVSINCLSSSSIVGASRLILLSFGTTKWSKHSTGLLQMVQGIRSSPKGTSHLVLGVKCSVSSCVAPSASGRVQRGPHLQCS